jgi:enterochelin esterase-like enzyme
LTAHGREPGQVIRCCNAVIWPLLALSILLTACGSPAAPLPTLVPVAVVPPPPEDDRLLPATYTIEAPDGPLLAAVAASTPRPTPTQEPTAIPLPSRTPTLLPLVDRYPQPVNAPYLEQPSLQAACDQTGMYFRSRFPSRIGGPWRYYHAYLPPCYGHDGRVYPVLYLIHGSIQTDSHWLDLGLAAYADAGIVAGRYPPFVAIMPYSGELGNISSGGNNSIEGITLNYLLPYVQANYCAWDDRTGRSIGGISRGGYWALEIAFLHPNLFGSAAGHSSHLRFETDPARYNPLATYTTVDLTGSRIWLDRGETDFLRVGQDQLHNLLTTAGIAHEYRVNPGGHNEAYWAAHLPEYLDWHAAAWPASRTAYPPCIR